MGDCLRTLAVFTVFIAIVSPSSSRSQSILERTRRDDVTLVPKDDPDMAAAMRKARALLPEFLTLAKAPPPGTSGFSLKVRVRDGDTVEYFWIIPFAVKDGQFSGKVDNEPRSVRNVALGQTITFAESEIVDWLYVDGGNMKGNYTTCAVLKHEPQHEAEEMMTHYHMQCDF
jgi:uncharacterized protein YegJ (DUF2314 family)